MKKILFIAPEPFFETRGTPINIREFVRRLGELTYEVDLLVLPHGKEVLLTGVNIIRCPRLPWVKEVPIGLSIRKILYDILLFFHAMYLCSRNRYLFIQGVEEGGLLGAFIGKMFGIPYVVDMDSLIPEEIRKSNLIFGKQFLAKTYDFLQRWAIKKAALVISVSNNLTEYVKQVAPQTVVSQIEDCPLELTNVHLPSEDLPYRKENKVTYLYTGNLEPYQGIDLLLAACSEMVARDSTLFQKIRFLIAGGTASQIEAYQSRAETSGLTSLITFLGQRPSSEMYNLMDISDFLVSPRLSCGNTPLKIYSYMQSKKPIIATSVDAHTSLLSDTQAFFADPTPGSLAETLLQTLKLYEENPHELKKRSENAYLLLESRYSRKAFRQKIDDTYHALALRIKTKESVPTTPKKDPNQVEISE